MKLGYKTCFTGDLPLHNNFDILRLACAVIVCIAHALFLQANTLPDWGHTMNYAAARAVECFFIISGFLIFRSYERSSTIWEYAKKRIRRIYPAYLFNILFFAVLLALFTSEPIWSYVFGKGGAIEFVLHRTAFLNDRSFTLPGLFADHRNAGVNGVLWTLRMEVLFYIMLPTVVFSCRRIGRTPVLAFLYLSSCVYSHLHAADGMEFLMNRFIHSLGFFVAGCGIYCFFDLFQKYKYTIPIAAVSITGAAQDNALMWYVFPAALAVCVMCFVFHMPFMGHATRYGDMSYGIYIYHFPILQILIDTIPANHPAIFFASAGILVPLSAWLSWEYIEKRFLPASSYYLRQTGGLHAG